MLNSQCNIHPPLPLAEVAGEGVKENKMHDLVKVIRVSRGYDHDRHSIGL